MSHSSSVLNNLNNMNNVNINLNIMNKFNKINRQNFKTISIHNSSATNYSKYNHSKENIQLTNNVQEKKKKNTINKKINIKKEKKNFIPKIKSEIINSQLISNNEGNFEKINYLSNNNNVNINTNNINNLNNKKEKQLRNHSSYHQKSNDIYDKSSKEINLLKKKLLSASNNTNNNSRHIPRANDRPINNDININHGNKLIKRSNTNSGFNENINNNLSIEILKYKNIIKILLYYIENLNKKIKYYLNKNQIEKNNKIKELSLQNKFLLNENKSLKVKLIQFFYVMKLYIKNGKKLFNEKYYKIIKSLIMENKFLRQINIIPKNINNTYLSQLKDQMLIEKVKKELLIHYQLTNRTDNSANNNIDEQNNYKDTNNPFCNSESSLNNLNNKVIHKRQRTHFNLGKLNEDNNSNRDSNGSIHNNSNEQNSISTNTVIENKDKDSSINKNIRNINNNKNENILCEALREMTNYNKTLKKLSNNSKKNLIENNNENNLNDLDNKNENNNNSYNNMKLNKIGNKIINNIPYDMNKLEHINIQNDKGDNRKIMKQKKDFKNNGYKNNSLNESENGYKKQSIYYRASREKEKRKIEFKK